MDRRDVLTASILVLGKAVSSDITFLYTESGPYRPISDVPLVNDLTRSGRAPGRPITVVGSLRDENGSPVPEANIVIWQSDTNGNYQHPDAPNQADLQPDFFYHGRTRTDIDGAYFFQTIMPGPYVYRGIRRAPHIHFEISIAGGCVASTEMYFVGAVDDQLRSQDLVWLSRDASRRDALIVDRRREADADFTQSLPTYQFDLVLDRSNSHVCPAKE